MSSDRPDSTSSDTATGPVFTPSLVRKSAYGFLVANLILVVLGIGFLTYGGLFGPLSDVASLLVALFLAPLIWYLYQLNREDSLNRVILWIGVGAVVAVIVGSIGLLVDKLLIPIPSGNWFLNIQFIGTIFEGIWLIGVGIVGLRTETITRRTSWAGIVGGAGTAGGTIALLYSYAVGTFSPLMGIAGVLYVVGITLWAFWLAAELS